MTAPKQRTLLAVMLIHPNQMVSADRLIDAVWGDTPPEAARRTLRYHISKLRDVLEPGRSKGSASDSLLVTEGSGYRLAGEPNQIDAGRFEEALEAGRRLTDPAEAAATFRRALNMWRGPALTEFEYEDFANPEIARLEELRITCLEERIAADLAAGQSSELVGELESVVAQHPYRERLRGLLMTALYRTGRQAEALQAYQAARQVLGEELGIDPSPELRELEERILLQDRSLAHAEPSARFPTGTVTFLFTDIAGSTRKWEQHPEAMREALVAHDEIVRQVIAAHHGSIFKHTGDGFAAVFTSATDAVAAATSIRAELSAREWGRVDGLEVKQALSTGDVVPREGDYFGPPVNLAARMAGVGNEGQILVSETTAGVIADRLPDHLTMIDLGPHRLHHISRPATIYQLQEAKGESHPPLRGGGSLRSNLPEPITPFIGREAELVAVRRAVTTHRLVTLTGLGGIGKTRLAQEVAGGLLDDVEHGVFHVDVATLDSADQIAEALVQAMFVEVEDEPTTALLQALHHREVLVVVDGMETLTESAVALVTEILAGCPRVTVLGTSRVAPPIPGGVVWAVPPLLAPREGPGAEPTEADAVRLFENRARLVDPDFAVTGDNERLVGDICRHLEGIPLALELAAARLKLLSLEDIAVAARRGPGAPGGGSGTAAKRRQNLDVVLEWSFDLLGEAERHLMGCLGVFRGGFDFTAAQEVCGGPSPGDDRMLDMLDELVDASLLTVDRSDGVRYGMLEVVRRHTIGQAGSIDEEIPTRYVHHFAALAVAAYDLLAGPDEALWLRRLDREQANFTQAVTAAFESGDHPAALRLVGNLGRFWLAAGYRRDARRWLHAIEPAAVSIDGARLIAGRVWLAMEQGNLGEMAVHADALSALAADLDDPVMLSEATKWQGNVLLLRGETEAAAVRFEDAATTTLAVGHPYAMVPTVWLGWASLALGRWDRAEECGGWLLDQNARLAEAWRLIGRSEMGRGASGAALEALERGVAAADEAGLPLHQIYARLDAARAALGDNNPAAAQARALEARDVAEQVGARASRDAALRLLIAVARDEGRADDLAAYEVELARTTAAGDDPPLQQVLLPGEGPLSGRAE